MFPLRVKSKPSKASAYFNKCANTVPLYSLPHASTRIGGSTRHSIYSAYFTRNSCYIIMTVYFNIEITTDTSLYKSLFSIDLFLSFSSSWK